MARNLVILGGGASGLMAAICAAEVLQEQIQKGAVQIQILERCDKVGRKILATGNGRCNLTNSNMDLSYFYGGNPALVSSVMEQFPLEDTLQFFAGLGLWTTEENGKIYPYSLQASTVLDLLRQRAAELGVVEKCSFEVSAIQSMKPGFLLKSKQGESVGVDILIMAAGGCASPSLGSNGTGHRLMTALGHQLTDLFPAITQIRTETDVVKSIQGIKVNGVLTLKEGATVCGRETGEILFTEYGISGPPAFQLARIVGEAVRDKKKRDIYAYIDFMPETDSQTLLGMLQTRAAAYQRKTLEQFMLGLFNKRIGQVFVKAINKKLTDKVEYMQEKDWAALARAIKNFRFHCIGTQSFQNAQVTAGGVSAHEFDCKTLLSKKVPGLYACGEVLDVDGACGGYNLQWAWSSGFVAGRSAAQACIALHS